MRSVPKPERRFVELRSDDAGGTGIVLRYGDRAAFGRFTERFEPGSVRLGRDMSANIMHERSKPVARIGAGLTVSDDGNSIEARIAWPDTTYGREAKELVEARILRGLSIEFLATKDRMDGTERIIEEAVMTGLGIVDRPAYPDSVIAERMAELMADVAPPKRRRLL